MRALNAFSGLFPFSHRRLKDGPCRQRDLQRSPNGKLIFPTSIKSCIRRSGLPNARSSTTTFAFPLTFCRTSKISQMDDDEEEKSSALGHSVAVLPQHSERAFLPAL